MEIVLTLICNTFFSKLVKDGPFRLFNTVAQIRIILTITTTHHKGKFLKNVFSSSVFANIFLEPYCFTTTSPG